MKILHVISDMNIGDAQRLLIDLIPIQRKNNEVALLVFRDADTEFTSMVLKQGIRIVSLKANALYNPKIIFRLRNEIKEYDIIHVHLFHALYWTSLASIGLNVNLVCTEHSTSNSRREKWYFRYIEQFVYARYNKIITISSETQEALMLWLNSRKDDSRFVCINNGIDTSRFYVSNHTNKTSSQRVKLMMVSRFAPAKDQKTVIRALTHLDTRFQLVRDGDTVEIVKRYASEQGVADRVSFLGMRQDIPELIASCDIGIQSSHWEGFGLTAVEFMAAGKPIIASRVPGLEQVVEGAGILFEKGNDIELAEIISHLSANENEYNRVVERCKIKAKEYDISNMGKAYMNVYQSLIGGDKYKQVIWTVYNPYSREEAA